MPVSLVMWYGIKLAVALAAWPVLPPPTAVVYQGMVRTEFFCESSPGGIAVYQVVGNKKR